MINNFNYSITSFDHNNQYFNTNKLQEYHKFNADFL